MARAKTHGPGRHEFILRLTEELRPITDPTAIQLHACTALAEHLSADFAHYAEYRLRERLVVVGPGFARRGYASIVGTYGVDDLGDPSGERELDRRTVAVTDTAAAVVLPRRARATYLTLRIGSFVMTTVAADETFVR